MLAWGHTALGSVVGLTTYQLIGESIHPGLGLIISGGAGVISHYIVDTIPHGHPFSTKDFKQKIIFALIFDVFLSVALFSYFAYLKFNLSLGFWYMLFGIGGALISDVIDGLIFLGFLRKSGLLKIENNIHLATHWHGRGEHVLRFSILDIWQILVVLIALFLVNGFRYF